MIELDLLATPVTHDPGDRHAVSLYAIFAVCFFASGATTAARLYVRCRMLRSVGRDDWVMLGAEIAFTLYLVTQLLHTVYGNGIHIEFLRQKDAETALMFWYIGVFFYIVSTCCVKISIAFFLLRFVHSKVQRWAIYAMNGACFSVAPAYIVFWLLVCRPVSFWWTLSPDAQGSCLPPIINLNAAYIVSGLNALANLVYAVVPLTIVWNSMMDRKTRILTGILLSFGSIAVIVTIARIPYERAFETYKGDFLYRTTPVVILSVVEIGIGIMTANAATLKPLVQRLWNSSWFGGRWQGSGDVPDDEEAAWENMCRVAKKTGLENPNMLNSLTGRESIGRMPSLVLMATKTEDDSSSRPGSSKSSQSSPLRSQPYRMSRSSWTIGVIAE